MMSSSSLSTQPDRMVGLFGLWCGCLQNPSFLFWFKPAHVPFRFDLYPTIWRIGNEIKEENVSFPASGPHL